MVKIKIYFTMHMLSETFSVNSIKRHQKEAKDIRSGRFHHGGLGFEDHIFNFVISPHGRVFPVSRPGKTEIAIAIFGGLNEERVSSNTFTSDQKMSMCNLTHILTHLYPGAQIENGNIETFDLDALMKGWGFGEKLTQKQ